MKVLAVYRFAIPWSVRAIGLRASEFRPLRLRSVLALGLGFGLVMACEAQTIANILNAASFTPVVAPGCWVAIFGSGLAASSFAGQSVPFPTQLNGVSVSIGGVAAPLSYVSPTQINALVPFEAATITGGNSVTVPVIVSTPSGASPAFSLRLQRSAPAIFSQNSTGAGAALAFDSAFNPVVNVGTAPIVFYATGLGPTNPPASTIAFSSARVWNPSIVCPYGNCKYRRQHRQRAVCRSAPGLDGIYQVNVQPDPWSGNSLFLTDGLYTSKALSAANPGRHERC